MTIFLDLKTKVLTESHQVFVARPGKQFRFYDEFANANLIGPELPGIELRTDTNPSEQDDIDIQLRKAQAIRSWAKRGKPEDNVPSEDPNEHRNARHPKGMPQFKYILEGYFEVAQKCDIAIIPPKSYKNETFIVEFTGGPRDIEYLQIEKAYGPFKIPTRRFKVLTTVPKRKLPAEILDIIAKPNTFVLLEKSLRTQIYDWAYGNYAYDNKYSAELDIRSDAYNTNDEFNLIAFLNFIAYHTKSLTIENDNYAVPIHEAAFVELGEYAPDLKSNINSPGVLNLSSAFISPIVIAVMLNIAISVGDDAVQAAEDNKVVIGNSETDGDDDCTATVRESVLKQLKILGIDKWAQACRIARRAEEESGVRGRPSVERRE